MSLNFISYGRSDAGTHREHNEDAFLDRAQCRLWAVADGMGGYRRGDRASRLLVEAFDSLPAHGAAPANATLAGGLADRVDAIDDAIERVNHELRLMAANENVGTIGTTACVLMTNETHAVLGWAGDSRAYLLRDRALTQISQDHALVAEMVDHGVLTPSQASTHPYGNLVTRAVGTSELMVMDVEILDIWSGDRFLLCTDGVNRVLSDDELAQALQEQPGRTACDWIIEQALVRGCRDNVTALVVDVVRPDDSDDPDQSGESTLDELMPLFDPHTTAAGQRT